MALCISGSATRTAIGVSVTTKKLSSSASRGGVVVTASAILAGAIVNHVRPVDISNYLGIFDVFTETHNKQVTIGDKQNTVILAVDSLSHLIKTDVPSFPELHNERTGMSAVVGKVAFSKVQASRNTTGSYMAIFCPIDYLVSCFSDGWNNDLGWDNDEGWNND